MDGLKTQKSNECTLTILRILRKALIYTLISCGYAINASHLRSVWAQIAFQLHLARIVIMDMNKPGRCLHASLEQLGAPKGSE